LCRPTWGYIIGQGIAAGELPDDPKWADTSWTTPKNVTVDAGRESANDRADVELGMVSLSEIYAQRGMDFRAEMEKRAQDMAHVAHLAKEYGLPFELLYRPSNTPAGTLSPLTENAEEEPMTEPSGAAEEEAS
ncbi:MAG: hypothetical protein RIR91_1885, partial [Verrucomicrobiota bacterium]